MAPCARQGQCSTCQLIGTAVASTAAQEQWPSREKPPQHGQLRQVILETAVVAGMDSGQIPAEHVVDEQCSSSYQLKH